VEFVLKSGYGKSVEELERDKSEVDRLSAQRNLPSVEEYACVLDSAADSIRSFQISRFATSTSWDKLKSSKQEAKSTALCHLERAQATEKAYEAVVSICSAPKQVTLQRLREFRAPKGPVRYIVEVRGTSLAARTTKGR
jgi:hypothetical protein